jgi:hypothetical protein
MPKTAPLISQIFNTGTKFIVTDDTKDSTFGPGTIGFVSYIKGPDQDYPNVVYINAAIIRRGKTGKRRIDFSEMSTPAFDFKDDNLGKVMPEEKRRYYVHIEPVLPYEDRVQKMSDIDFLGWAHSQARYVQKLSTKAKHVAVWPSESGSLLNRILNVNENYSEDMDDSLTNSEAREKFSKSVRMLESTLVKSALLYMCKVAEVEKRAISCLCQEGLNIGNPDVMEKTMHVFKSKKDTLQTLMVNHGNKAMLEDVKKAINGMSWL